MSKELIERLRIFVADPVLGGVIEEATDRIEQLETELKTERCLSFRNQVAELEAERDKLREQVKMLRDEVIRCRDWFETQAKVTSKGGPSSWELMLLRDERDAADEVLSATEPKE